MEAQKPVASTCTETCNPPHLKAARLAQCCSVERPHVLVKHTPTLPLERKARITLWGDGGVWRRVAGVWCCSSVLLLLLMMAASQVEGGREG